MAASEPRLKSSPPCSGRGRVYGESVTSPAKRDVVGRLRRLRRRYFAFIVTPCAAHASTVWHKVAGNDLSFATIGLVERGMQSLA